MTNVDVATAIRRAEADRATRTKVAQDQVIETLVAIAISDPRSYFDEHGCLRAPDELNARAAAAMASLQVNDLPDNAGTVNRLKLCDKVNALELLGRHLGMFQGRGPPEGGVLRIALALFSAQTRTSQGYNLLRLGRREIQCHLQLVRLGRRGTQGHR